MLGNWNNLNEIAYNIAYKLVGTLIKDWRKDNSEHAQLIAKLQLKLEQLRAQGVVHLNLNPLNVSLQNTVKPSEAIPAPEPQAAMLAEAPAPTTPQMPRVVADLSDLRQQALACTRCKLSETRHSVVFGEGSTAAKVMFVGEAPGSDEDQLGRPFVGKAGRLLTAVIQALGLVRDDIYIANIVKCRPPDNRMPQPDEVKSCSPYLEEQIQEIKPMVIVTLGNVPLRYFNPKAGGITKSHGQTFAYRGITVYPTFHPAFILRSSSYMLSWWNDMQQVFQLTQSD